ncbi:MAG: substrate-binding domain-containing protein [Campylobacteraceae bacterium]|jgi:phosphate transport system substrate-binding protein|nr:substrate-binding domain-containing protein [Campylobacteraceae bacterium]
MFKKILTNIYVVLFVYIPLIAHIVCSLCFIFGGIAGGKVGMKIFVVSMFIFSLTIFIFFGYFWAKKFINKINFATYFALFAFLIYTLICLNLAFIISGWSYSDKYFEMIALFSNVTFIPINFLFIFSGKPLYVFLLQIVFYGLFGSGIALALLQKELLRPVKKPMVILISIVLILTLSFVTQLLLRNSHFLPYSVTKFEKFIENNKNNNHTATLRGDLTLKLENNFPKLDGATALCLVFLSVYEAMYPKMQNQYDYARCSSTPQAYNNLINGNVELIFVAAPSNAQLQIAKEKGVELTLTPIGKEAFVFLANRQNPINSLSIENIRGIYSGKIKNWREFGGENRKILAFQRNENSGSQTAMQKYVMKDTPFISPIQEEFHGSMGGMIEGTANYRNAPNAIGYSFRYYATVMNSNENIKLLSIEGIEPTVENIKNNTYPFTAEFYIVNTQNISQNGQKLIDWFLSEQGQALIEDIGYVPIREF